MAEIFNLPAVGDAMVEGEIVEWFVSVGDTVELDQAICSIETDKSVVELSTPFRGTVLQLGGAPGDVVAVGSPLLVVGQEGEPLPDLPASGTFDSPAASAHDEPAPVAEVSPDGGVGVVLSPVVRRLASEHEIDLATVTGSGPGGRVTRTDVEARIHQPVPAPTNGRTLAMPGVRKAARERSIDLTAIGGSGPRGSITLADLEAAEKARGHGERRVPMSAMRRSIAAHLTRSAQTVPQFTSMVEFDATALLATRRALASRSAAPVPIDALFVHLLIPVLRDHPVMTATLDGDEIVYFDRYDIGVAVDTPEGLMVPVVSGADQMSIAETAAEIVRLAAAARDRTLAPAELTGGTCTVNNVGALGILAGTPILPLGTSVIVGFGKARPVVELRDGVPLSVPTITVSATFDHRLVDGGDSARFLGQLTDHLEVPALGLLA